MNAIFGSKPPAWFWVVAVLALAWEIMGVGSFVMHVRMTPEEIAALPQGQAALMQATPPWVYGFFALATVGGLLGAIGLLMRRLWARPLLIASLVGIIVQFGWTFAIGKAHELIGPSAAYFPIGIFLIGVFLVWFAGHSAKRGWLR